jgi:folate-binding protein YgfZ
LKQLLGQTKKRSRRTSVQSVRDGLAGPRAPHEYDRFVIATGEYELVTESVGLVDRSERGMFLVRGGDAVDFLQGQVSNDVESLEPGHGCYATVLNHKGKLRTDLRILRGPDFVWLDTEAVGHAVVRHMLDTYTLGRDVQWEDVGGSRAILSLIGPAADGLPDEPPGREENAFVDGDGELWVRTDLGIDLVCDAARAEELRIELGVEPVSEEVAECLRIESGRPRLGLDMDAETIPQEAGINERAVDFEKGCYVGQETVARLHYKGRPNRHLRGLRLSAPVERRTEIALGDKVVGHVGSTCVSPRFGPIALALVRREAAPGDTVRVGEAEARVVELPFE